jgi:pyruvate kinase
VNVPGVELKMPFISEKDKNDILFGIKEGFDFIAASFTRTADDILEIKKLLADNNCDTINIIAKIENQQGVDNIDEIIAVSDGIMVARGDMGVEIPLEDVPVIQKKIIRKVNEAGKQVITATQMLDSMIKNPRPTRAEATDVANAIYQGTSAIMLSGETAAGKYPVEALKTMDKIAVRIEGDIDYEEQLRKYKMDEKKDMTTAISHATCLTAMELDAKAIITVSKSGKTARMVSKYHPNCMVIGCTTTEYNCRQLNMSWGIYPIMLREEYSMDVLFVHAVEAAKKRGYVEDEDIIVLTAGVPLGRSGNTNLIRTNVVKDF